MTDARVDELQKEVTELRSLLTELRAENEDLRDVCTRNGISCTEWIAARRHRRSFAALRLEHGLEIETPAEETLCALHHKLTEFSGSVFSMLLISRQHWTRHQFLMRVGEAVGEFLAPVAPSTVAPEELAERELEERDEEEDAAAADGDQSEADAARELFLTRKKEKAMNRKKKQLAKKRLGRDYQDALSRGLKQASSADILRYFESLGAPVAVGDVPSISEDIAQDIGPIGGWHPDGPIGMDIPTGSVLTGPGLSGPRIPGPGLDPFAFVSAPPPALTPLVEEAARYNRPGFEYKNPGTEALDGVPYALHSKIW